MRIKRLAHTIFVKFKRHPNKNNKMKYVITLFSFLLAGLFILPFIFFAINDFIFGKYAGEGFTGYYIEYFKMLRGGSLAAWFISLFCLYNS
jgi:hypothetical protein